MLDALLRRYSHRARDGPGCELVVVGQAVVVGLLQLLRQVRVLALRRLDTRALLCCFVPSFPTLPPPHLPRLPRERVRLEGDLQVLAVGGEYAHGVLAEGHGIHDHDILRVQLRRVPEQAVELLEAGLFEGKVGPHTMKRRYHVLRIPDDEGVSEAGDELRAHQVLGLVGHVLDEDAFLAGLEDPLQDVLVVVLCLRLLVRVAGAETFLAIVIRVPEWLVEDLEVVPLHEDPLERGRYGPGHRPQRNSLFLFHVRLPLALHRLMYPSPALLTHEATRRLKHTLPVRRSPVLPRT